MDICEKNLEENDHQNKKISAANGNLYQNGVGKRNQRTMVGDFDRFGYLFGLFLDCICMVVYRSNHRLWTLHPILDDSVHGCHTNGAE